MTRRDTKNERWSGIPETNEVWVGRKEERKEGEQGFRTREGRKEREKERENKKERGKNKPKH